MAGTKRFGPGHALYTITPVVPGSHAVHCLAERIRFALLIINVFELERAQGGRAYELSVSMHYTRLKHSMPV